MQGNLERLIKIGNSTKTYTFNLGYYLILDIIVRTRYQFINITYVSFVPIHNSKNSSK